MNNLWWEVLWSWECNTGFHNSSYQKTFRSSRLDTRGKPDPAVCFLPVQLLPNFPNSSHYSQVAWRTCAHQPLGTACTQLYPNLHLPVDPCFPPLFISCLYPAPSPHLSNSCFLHKVFQCWGNSARLSRAPDFLTCVLWHLITHCLPCIVIYFLYCHFSWVCGICLVSLTLLLQTLSCMSDSLPVMDTQHEAASGNQATPSIWLGCQAPLSSLSLTGGSLSISTRWKQHFELHGKNILYREETNTLLLPKFSEEI